MDHIQLNKILIDNLTLIEDVSYALDNQLQTRFDFSKAFDTVPHKHLLAKLQHYKINPVPCMGMDPIMAYSTRSISNCDGASSQPVSVLSARGLS